MKAIITAILSLVLIVPLLAQIDIPRTSLNPYQNNGSSLMGLNHLSMRHSMGFSAGTSSSGDGYYLSRYTNHLKYQFNPKLDLELDLNIVNFGSTSTGFQINDDNKSKILPEFRLSYKPSDSMSFQIEFRQGNPYAMDNRPWYERW